MNKMKREIIMVHRKFRPMCFGDYIKKSECKHCPWKKECEKEQSAEVYGKALWESLNAHCIIDYEVNRPEE